MLLYLKKFGVNSNKNRIVLNGPDGVVGPVAMWSVVEVIEYQRGRVFSVIWGSLDALARPKNGNYVSRSNCYSCFY